MIGKDLDPQKILDSFTAQLKDQLKDDVYSCSVYGSYVKGYFKKNKSDINVLLIVKKTTNDYLKKLSTIVKKHIPVNPMIVNLNDYTRNMDCFTVKFLSIKRNYILLLGKDPFKEWIQNSDIDKFACEQQLRNIYLRFIHTYVYKNETIDVNLYCKKMLPNLIIILSEVLRIMKIDVPKNYSDRIPIFNATFNANFDILVLKNLNARKLKNEALFNEMLMIFDKVITYVNVKWKLPFTREAP